LSCSGILIIVQQDATYSVYYISVGSCPQKYNKLNKSNLVGQLLNLIRDARTHVYIKKIVLGYYVVSTVQWLQTVRKIVMPAGSLIELFDFEDKALRSLNRSNHSAIEAA